MGPIGANVLYEKVKGKEALQKKPNSGGFQNFSYTLTGST